MSARPSRRTWWSDGIPVGRLAGIPVLITPSWLLSVLAIALLAGPLVGELVPGTSASGGYLTAAALGLLLGVSVLAHEWGHCVLARLRGLPVQDVRLHLLGGESRISGAPATPRDEAVIAAAGPAISLLLTALCAGGAALTESRTLPWLLFLQLALVNGLVTVLNLLPALPLDGGRVLRAGVWRASGRRSVGTTVAVICGWAVSFGMVVTGVTLLFLGTRLAVLQGVIALLIGAYVAAGATAESAKKHAGPGIAEWLRPLQRVPGHWTVGSFDTAAEHLWVIESSGEVQGLVTPEQLEAVRHSAPDTPVSALATPVDPGALILSTDTFRELMEAVRRGSSDRLLVIDEEGAAVGVLLAEDVARLVLRGPNT